MSDDLNDPSDHDLLAGGVRDLVAESTAAHARLARMLVFHDRCAIHRAQEPGVPGWRSLTATAETVVEVGELWGLSPGRVRSDLQRARVLSTVFPGVWELCLAGQLDTYRAGLVADAATGTLPETQWPALAARITGWLQSRLRRPGNDPDLPEVVCCTVKQLRNKLTYETTKLRPRDADARFQRAYRDRHVSARTHPIDGTVGDGMGSLTVQHSVDQIQLADYRLTLAAKALRAGGDERTLDQLRADLALDLIIGRTQIQSTLTELEDLAENPTPAPAPDTGNPVPDWLIKVPTSGFARPIINLTVPIQTLMGLCDDPGILSGGTVVPATLARMIAQQPDSTWHRMLTDPTRSHDDDGGVVEISTTSYRPTRTIWNDVIARYQTCFRAGCDRPAADCETDHKIPHPAGPTSTGNLQPACDTDHTAKQTPGYALHTDSDGNDTFRTRAGFTHPVTHATPPVADTTVPEDLFGFQYTATELIDALTHLAELQHASRTMPTTGLLDEIWADVS